MKIMTFNSAKSNCSQFNSDIALEAYAEANIPAPQNRFTANRVKGSLNQQLEAISGPIETHRFFECYSTIVSPSQSRFRNYNIH